MIKYGILKGGIRMSDSNIEKLLKQILDTKLGKDMRQAIHDSIKQ